MEFKVKDLGLIGFPEAEAIQRNVFEEVRSGSSEGALLLCQHLPVITLGRSANRKDIIASEQELAERGIKIFQTQRGGKVTYHGPGQLIAYPIFNLSYFKKDIHFFLRRLEEAVIELISDFGIRAERVAGSTGVWVRKQKIASIGIAIRQWITFHGLSLNIKKEDLGNFNLIKPCGMDIKMTSLETLAGREIEMGEVREGFEKKFRAWLNVYSAHSAE